MTAKKDAKKDAKKTPKPAKKPTKGKYLPPEPKDWKEKPALVKLVQQFGKAAPAVHKLQHDLKTERARVKKYATAMAVTIGRLAAAGDLLSVEILRSALDS